MLKLSENVSGSVILARPLGRSSRVKSVTDLPVRMKKIVLSGDKTGNVFYQIIDTLSRGISLDHAPGARIPLWIEYIG